MIVNPLFKSYQLVLGSQRLKVRTELGFTLHMDDIDYLNQILLYCSLKRGGNIGIKT